MSKRFLIGVVGCVLGVVITMLSGGRTAAVAQSAQPGRYVVSAVQMEANRALVVVLDTATGQVHPYFHGGTHDGLSFFPIQTHEMKR